MKRFLLSLLVCSAPSWAAELSVIRNVPYAEAAHERQVLDVYAPTGAKNLPVVYWIHGGGWQGGSKDDLKAKPAFFAAQGFVTVAINHRLLPGTEMREIVRDAAKGLGWVHRTIAKHGGDPGRIWVMGHSSGAQLAALLCTDERYLKAEGVPFAVLRGCVPVDGDTYDIPAMIEVAETRARVHGLPLPKYGHRLKFGNDPALHRDFSAVAHMAKNKGIPPFLVLHVAGHPDVSAQAQRLGAVLKENGIPGRVFGAKDTDHGRINANLGVAGDPATAAVAEFLKGALSGKR
ncbi:MAG: para-nitrobenzyl esterase [Opitutia bacterium Tous-C1TDCM]|nr:MAG: para-nitrobenzyl esterase [Opitutae bacterium Tous-C1TDCM]